MKAASQTPSDVRIRTSRSRIRGSAAVVDPVAAISPAAAADIATNSRREELAGACWSRPLWLLGVFIYLPSCLNCLLFFWRDILSSSRWAASRSELATAHQWGARQLQVNLSSCCQPRQS